jgi:hypothetical protein
MKPDTKHLTPINPVYYLLSPIPYLAMRFNAKPQRDAKNTQKAELGLMLSRGVIAFASGSLGDSHTPKRKQSPSIDLHVAGELPALRHPTAWAPSPPPHHRTAAPTPDGKSVTAFLA